MARSSVGCGMGRGGGRSAGGGRGSVRGSTDTVGRVQSDHTSMPSPNEGGVDVDVESAVHVAPVRRGSVSQVQVPERVNREWISIEYGQ